MPRHRTNARRQALLHAALALFIEQGMASTTIEAITQRAGVSKGTLYLYCDGKAAILAHLVAERFFCRFPQLDGSKGLCANGQLAAVAEAWRLALAEGGLGGLAKLALMETPHAPAVSELWHAQVMAPTQAAVRIALQHGWERGCLRRVEPHAVTHALVGPMVMNWLQAHATTQPDPSACWALDPARVAGHVQDLWLGRVA